MIAIFLYLKISTNIVSIDELCLSRNYFILLWAILIFDVATANLLEKLILILLKIQNVDSNSWCTTKIRKDRVHQKIWQQFWFLLPQFSPLFTVENHPSSPMWCTHAFVYVIRNTCAYMREFCTVWNKITITSVL